MFKAISLLLGLGLISIVSWLLKHFVAILATLGVALFGYTIVRYVSWDTAVSYSLVASGHIKSDAIYGIIFVIAILWATIMTVRCIQHKSKLRLYDHI